MYHGFSYKVVHYVINLGLDVIEDKMTSTARLYNIIPFNFIEFSKDDDTVLPLGIYHHSTKR
jgi:hypothetical protein